MPALSSFERCFYHGGQGRRKRLGCGNFALRVIRAKGKRMLQNAGHNHILTRAALRNRLLLPEQWIAPKLCKGTKTPAAGETNRDRPTRECDRTPLTYGGRPARRGSRFSSPVKGDNARVGQQLRGDQQYNRRLPKFRRLRREMRVRARDSSR